MTLCGGVRRASSTRLCVQMHRCPVLYCRIRLPRCYVVRDGVNPRRTANPFDDIKARAQQPTQFNQTLAGTYSEAVVLWQSALVMGW